MIIDRILDRKDGFVYNEEEDLKYMYDEAMLFGFDYLSEALDAGNNLDIQKALARYIIENDYNVDIINYVYSVIWLNECFW